MKKIIATLAAFAALAVAGAASASPLTGVLNGLYVQGQFGANYQSNRDTGSAASISVGKYIIPGVRAEVEYIGARGNDSTKLGGTTSNVFNLNALVEPTTILGATPFIGGGIGYGSMARSGIVGSTNGVVFNVQSGLSYPITKKLTFVTAYRYVIANSVDIRTSKIGIDNYNASSATVGVRYAF
jgi:opacity protein-like surface antigen